MIFMVAALLPQSSWADDVTLAYTEGGNSLVINCTTAGAVSTFMSTISSDVKTAITSKTNIVLNGNFNVDDLNALRQDQGFQPTSVDMSRAIFSDPSTITFRQWNNSITTAICPSGLNPSDFGSELLLNCGNINFVDFGNINMRLTPEGGAANTLTISQDEAGPLSYSTLSTLLGRSNRFDNKTIVYDSSIDQIEYDTYIVTFDGTTAIISAKDEQTASITNESDPTVKFINANCTTVKFTGAMGSLSAFNNGNKVATTVDFSDATFATGTDMTFSPWKSTITYAICAPNITTYGQSGSDHTFDGCDNLQTIDIDNIVITKDENCLTISGKQSGTAFESTKLLAYLSSNNNLSSYPTNKFILYGDNIASVHFTNSDTTPVSDYIMYFNGTTVEIRNNMDNDGVVTIAQRHAKSTMNFQTLKFTGAFTALTTSFQENGNFKVQHSTLDFSEAQLDDNNYALNNWKHAAKKISFSNGEATIGDKPEEGPTPITIKAADTASQNAIEEILKHNNDNAWYPEGTSSGQYSYTKTSSDVAVETTWTSPTLSVGTTDTNNIGTENVKDLCTIVTKKSVDANELTTITFADGSTYDKATGKLVTTSTNYVAIKMWIEACEILGLHVNTIELGKYVSIDYTNASYPEGITIINNTGTDAMEHLIGQSVSRNTNLTDAEKKAITDAVHLKMNGQFDNDDFLGLKNVKSGVGSVMPTTLDFSEAQLLSDQRMPSDWATSVTEIKLPGSFVDVTDNTKTTTEIPAGFCENFTHITSVNIPNTITSVGESAFRGCTQLNVVDWSTALVEIKDHAFERCGFGPTLIIPNSVKYIREDAFRNCYYVNYLYIQEGSMLEVVESGAFFNDERDMPGLKEVHVDCNHFIWCDIDAFDDTHTNGHTDVATAKCRLFYPAVGITDYDPDYPEVVTESENKNSFQDFVGVFKSKLFNGRMKQSDLQTLKTVITEGGVGPDGKEYGPYPGHGWFMFTSSGITITPTTTWRTYSEAVNFTVPEATLAEIYLVCGYESNDNASVTKLVKMKPGDVIPANTGVIIHYVSDEDYSQVGNEKVLTESVIMSFDYYDSESPLEKIDAQEGAKYTKGGQEYENYLRKLNVDPVYIYNVEKVNGEPTYRNFFFNNATQMNNLDAEGQEKWWGKDWGTDCRNLKGWGFFRAKTGNYAVNNKAYLHFPATMASATAGASTTSEVSTNAPALGIVIINDDDTTTKIDNVVISQDNLKLVSDCYYTLSGQRVMTPVKGGIYIHNGKKVIVK